MQRLRVAWGSGGVCACTCATRHFRKDLSPDRTYSEQIQDAQNRFNWRQKHTFRPHQHFTYDPTSWSRPLEEQSKRQAHPALALVERIRMEQERLAEREANAATVQSSDKDIHDEATPNAQHVDDTPDYYFFATEDVAQAASETELANPWEAVPLQELLDAISAAQLQLSSPRFRGNESLALSNRLRVQLRELLRQVFARLERAVVDETMTLDALVFAWFVTLASREDLLLALADVDRPDGAGENEAALETAMQRIEKALRCTVFSCDVLDRLSSLPLDGLVEALQVLTHPSTRTLLSHDDAPPHHHDRVIMSVCTEIAKGLDDARLGAATNASAPHDADGEISEAAFVLDPLHLAVLAESLSHVADSPLAQSTKTAERDAFDDLPLRSVVHALHHTNRVILRVLQSSMPTSRQHAVRRALTKPVRNSTTSSLQIESDAWDHRAVELDACEPPRGVKQPSTDPDDVTHLVRAYVAVLPLLQDHSHREGAESSANALVEAALLLLSHAPNYDLPVRATLLFAHHALQCLQAPRAGTGGTAQEQSWLRLGLLLSRVDFTRCGRRQDALYTVLVDLCDLREPHFVSVRHRSEWRRLRGLALHHLLAATTAPLLRQATTSLEPSSGATSWEVSAAFGGASTTGVPVVIPPLLWEQACADRLGAISTTTKERRRLESPDCEVALALVVLRARLADARRGHQRCGVDGTTLRYVAACMHVVAGERRSVDALVSGGEGAWEEMLNIFLGGPCANAANGDAELVAGLFSELHEFARRVRPDASKVTVFS